MDYQHDRWLKPFKNDNLDSCRFLNILVENFPDRYNPASVLQIDMFNTSEEKLQDQLTKTMSVVFEVHLLIVTLLATNSNTNII